jgi:hypothetical protein
MLTSGLSIYYGRNIELIRQFVKLTTNIIPKTNCIPSLVALRRKSEGSQNVPHFLGFERFSISSAFHYRVCVIRELFDMDPTIFLYAVAEGETDLDRNTATIEPILLPDCILLAFKNGGEVSLQLWGICDAGPQDSCEDSHS